jgi:RNA recognition motif-containing protein
MDATTEQLEAGFKQFGSIKHDGIQVRSNKVCLRLNFVQFHFEFLFLMIFTCYVSFSSIQQQGSCFGFVEFESASSMQLAIEVLALLFCFLQPLICYPLS